MLGHEPVALVGGRPRVRPERGDPEVVAHGPHVRVLAVGDVLQLVDGRNPIAHGSSTSAPTLSNAAPLTSGEDEARVEADGARQGHEQRIDLDLRDLGVGRGHERERGRCLGRGTNGDRLTPSCAGQQARAPERAQEILELVGARRRERNGNVTKQLGVDAAEADEHEWPEARIAAAADDQLDATCARDERLHRFNTRQRRSRRVAPWLPTPNESLIERFYGAFDRATGRRWRPATRPTRILDPVFTDLSGTEAGDMWRMLTGGATDLKVELHEHDADEERARRTGSRHYTFAQTGRPVVNDIQASFRFRDGRIAEHHDEFDFYRWARQALGARGLLLGWTPIVRNAVRRRAAAGLEEFVANDNASSPETG